MTVIGHGYDDNVGAPAFRNLVINGGFDVWQRGTSFATGTLGSPYYGPDRWQAFRIITASGVTVSRQNSDLAGFNYFVRCQRDSGNTNIFPFILGTSFETVNVRRVQGKYLTLSFWARKNAGFSGSYLDVSVATGTGTDSNMYNGFTSSSTPINTTAALTTSWQRFTFTTSAVMASNITQLGLNIACTTYSGTAGASDYFDVTGVQLEAGSVATPFEFEPFETTLRKCQRYFTKSTPSDQPTFTTLAADSNMNAGCCWITSSTNGGGVRIPFPVEMRAVPTVDFRAWTSVNDNISNGGSFTSHAPGLGDLTSILEYKSKTGLSIYTTAVGYRSFFFWRANAEL